MAKKHLGTHMSSSRTDAQFKAVCTQLMLAQAERKATIEYLQSLTGCRRVEAVAFLLTAMSADWPEDRMEAELRSLANEVTGRRPAQ